MYNSKIPGSTCVHFQTYLQRPQRDSEDLSASVTLPFSSCMILGKICNTLSLRFLGIK